MVYMLPNSSANCVKSASVYSVFIFEKRRGGGGGHCLSLANYGETSSNGLESKTNVTLVNEKNERDEKEKDVGRSDKVSSIISGFWYFWLILHFPPFWRIAIPTISIVATLNLPLPLTCNDVAYLCTTS